MKARFHTPGQNEKNNSNNQPKQKRQNKGKCPSFGAFLDGRGDWQIDGFATIMFHRCRPVGGLCHHQHELQIYGVLSEGENAAVKIRLPLFKEDAFIGEAFAGVKSPFIRAIYLFHQIGRYAPFIILIIRFIGPFFRDYMKISERRFFKQRVNNRTVK